MKEYVREGETDRAKSHITIKSGDFVNVASGVLTPLQALQEVSSPTT